MTKTLSKRAQTSDQVALQYRDNECHTAHTYEKVTCKRAAIFEVVQSPELMPRRIPTQIMLRRLWNMHSIEIKSK